MSRLRLFLLLACLLTLNPAQGFPQRVDSGYKLLWKISGNHLNKPSYLFGTMHTRDERAFNFPDSLWIALDHVDAFAMELDPDSMMKISYRMQLAQESEKSIAGFLYGGPSKLQADYKGNLSSIPIQDLPFTQSWLYQPSGYMEFITRSKYPTFLDAFLYRLAIVHGKSFQPVEKVEEQLQVFADENDNNWGKNPTGLISAFTSQRKLVSLYWSGDLDGVTKWMDRMKTDNEGWYDALIGRRNVVMAERIEKLIRDKSYFVAIGAGHLGGEGGVITRLQEMGFQVQPVSATFSGNTYEFESAQTDPAWQTMSSSHGIFSASMPGNPVVWGLPQWGSHFLISPDISSGTSYFGADFIASGAGKPFKASKLFKAVEEELAEMEEFNLEESDKISLGEWEGYEWLFSTKKKLSLRLRLYIKDGMGFMLGGVLPPGYTSHQDLSRFFESVKILTPSPVKREFVTLTDKSGEIRYKIPKGFKKGSVPLDFYDSEMWTTNVTSVNIPQSGESFTVTWTDPPTGIYFDNDSTLLASELEEMLDRTRCKIVTQRMDTFKGLPAVFFELRNSWDDTYYRGLYAVKGIRIFGFLHSSHMPGKLIAENHPFFQEIEFLPVEAVPMTVFKDSLNLFSVMTPGQPEFESEEFYGSYFMEEPSFLKERQSWMFPYKASGGSFLVVADELIDYIQVDTDSALFRQALNEMVYASENVEQTFFGEKNGLPTAVYNVTTDKTRQVREFTIVWTGQKFLTLLLTRVPGIRDPNLEKIRNSFQVFAESSPREYRSEPFEKYRKDLLSRDPERVNMATRWGDYVVLDSSQSDQLFEVYDATLNWEDTLGPQVREHLVDRWIYDSLSVQAPQISQIYKQLPDTSATRARLLEHLLDMESEEGYRHWLTLVTENPPAFKDAWAYLDVFYPLFDTVVHPDILFPAAHQLLSHPDMRYYWAAIIDLSGEDSLLNPAEIPGLYDVAFEGLEIWLADSASEEKSELPSYLTDYLISILGYFSPENQDKEQPLWDYLTAEGTLSDKLTYYLTMLRRTGDPVIALQDSFNVESGFLRAFYKGLKKQNRLDLLPEKLRNQQSMALGDLTHELLILEDESIREIRIDTEIEREVKGKNQRFFLIRFNLESDPYTDYAGLAGPFELDADNLDSNTNYTYSLFYEWEELTREAHIEKFFE